MEGFNGYKAKCRKCPYFRTMVCYGELKGKRNIRCVLAFQNIRRRYVANMPRAGRVDSSDRPVWPA